MINKVASEYRLEEIAKERTGRDNEGRGVECTALGRTVLLSQGLGTVSAEAEGGREGGCDGRGAGRAERGGPGRSAEGLMSQ